MTVPVSKLKQDLLDIVRAGVDAVGASRVIDRALDSDLEEIMTSRPNHVVSVGKAAAAMTAAFLKVAHLGAEKVLAIGTHGRELLPPQVEWIESSHPFPDARSQAAAGRALAVAAGVQSGGVLVLLISGGASSLMAAPIDGLSLEQKTATSRLMMNAGADIHALNTVRRHLSTVKGGRLAAACVGTTITLAISDVVGDDLNAIGSGPGVPDPTTWIDAAAALDRFGGAAHAGAVRALVDRGVAGDVAETPKRGDRSMARTHALVIGSRAEAMAGARDAAVARGYHPIVMPDPVIGEAREVALAWLSQVRQVIANAPRPACVISSGETTVRVTGKGRGGRNLEFALALAEAVSQLPSAVMASIGTDGIDGSSGVAGGLVDSTTMARAQAKGLDAPGHFLAANDSFAFFASLGDDVRLGRTDTNVGDLQVLLID